MDNNFQVALFVIPYIGEFDNRGMLFLKNLSIDEIKTICPNCVLEIEKPFTSYNDVLLFLQEKLSKLSDILQE